MGTKSSARGVYLIGNTHRISGKSSKYLPHCMRRDCAQDLYELALRMEVVYLVLICMIIIPVDYTTKGRNSIIR